MSQIALCLDDESMRQPALLGLAGENLAAQEWLSLFTSAEEARARLRTSSDIDEVWVASSDDVDPINLAAALKRDRGERGVYLLAFQGTGSLWSRASAAGVDATLSHQAFAKRYAKEKSRRSRRLLAPALPAVSSVSAVPVAQTAPAASMAPVVPAPSVLIEPTVPVEVPVAAGAPAPTKERLSVLFPDDAKESVARRGVAASAVRTVHVSDTHHAFFLPVVSGSGGAGKSTVALMAAVVARKLGYETLLVDLDLQFGDMREMLGVPDALSVDEVLAAPARVTHLTGDGGKPALLAAPRRLETAEAAMADVPLLLDGLMPRFDVIVANTGSFWLEQHVSLLERCSKALFLVDQRASSLRACKHAVELCARCGIATNPFVFAANRCAKGAPFTSLDVSCALQGARAFELRDGGRDVEDLLSAGMPLDLVADRNELCLSVEKLLVELLPGPSTADEARMVEVVGESGGFFRKRRSRRKRGVA